MQASNIRQASSQPVQPLAQNSQTLSGLPPLPQNKMQLGSLPFAQDSRVSAGVPNQYATLQKFPTQTQIQHPQLNQNQALQQAQLLAQSGVSSHPSMHPQSLSGLSVGQQIPVPTSFNQQMQHPLSQNIGSVPAASSGYNAVPRSQTVAAHASVLVNPQFSAAGYQVRNFTQYDNRGHNFELYYLFKFIYFMSAYVYRKCLSQKICFSSHNNYSFSELFHLHIIAMINYKNYALDVTIPRIVD